MALWQEEKIASIEIAQSPGAGQGPAAATAFSPHCEPWGGRKGVTGMGTGTEG